MRMREEMKSMKLNSCCAVSSAASTRYGLGSGAVLPDVHLWCRTGLKEMTGQNDAPSKKHVDRAGEHYGKR